MKKVISALTAAAMCASMAGIMTASAVYSGSDIGYELRVLDTGVGTVSDGGSTITFASGEAKGKTITLQHFVIADTASPSVQQIGANYTASDANIKLKVGKDDYSGYYSETKEYQNKAGKTFKTDAFVTTFDFLTKTGKYGAGTGSVTWGHSDAFPASWNATNKADVVTFNWQYSFADNTRDDGTKTAAYLGEKSDSFPINEFTAELGDLADGTYEITFNTVQYNPDRQGVDVNWMQVNDTDKVTVTGSLKGITIVVGDGSVTPPPTEDQPVTEKPTQTITPTEEITPTNPPATEKPTDPSTPGNPGGDRDYNYKDFTWYVKDAHLDYQPDEEFQMVDIEICVANDPGTYSVAGGFLMDSKNAEDSGWFIDSIEPAGAYKKLNQFTSGLDKGVFAGVVKSDTILEDLKAADGEAVIIVTLATDMKLDDMKDSYKLDLTNLSLANFAQEKFTPANYEGGTLYVKDGPVTPPTTDPVTPPETDPVTPPETDPVTPGDYKYGDVNKNNKVELVDVVMLNRFITGYDNQDLDEYQVVVANCYREKGESDADSKKADLDGKDSVSILKYLIGKIPALPEK